ncbi:hypothetical protein O2N63_00005, partial [Aliiroseovarius sp. KMU-50]
ALSDFEKDLIIAHYANSDMPLTAFADRLGQDPERLRRLKNRKAGKQLLAWLERTNPPYHYINYHFTDERPVPYALSHYREIKEFLEKRGDD